VIILSPTESLSGNNLIYTTVSPFDIETFQSNVDGDIIFLCEPYYTGGLDYDIIKGIKSSY